MSQLTPAEILDRAADVIDERGHCKGTLENSRRAVCANGAILVAYHGVPDWPGDLGAPEHNTLLGAIRSLAAAVDASAIVLEWGVPDWNNAPERTAAEVTSTMRAVALTLRAQQRSDKPHSQVRPEVCGVRIT
jgi:hypothetical protein